MWFSSLFFSSLLFSSSIIAFTFESLSHQIKFWKTKIRHTSLPFRGWSTWIELLCSLDSLIKVYDLSQWLELRKKLLFFFIFQQKRLKDCKNVSRKRVCKTIIYFIQDYYTLLTQMNSSVLYYPPLSLYHTMYIKTIIKVRYEIRLTLFNLLYEVNWKVNEQLLYTLEKTFKVFMEFSLLYFQESSLPLPPSSSSSLHEMTRVTKLDVYLWFILLFHSSLSLSPSFFDHTIKLPQRLLFHGQSQWNFMHPLTSQVPLPTILTENSSSKWIGRLQSICKEYLPVYKPSVDSIQLLSELLWEQHNKITSITIKLINCIEWGVYKD